MSTTLLKQRPEHKNHPKFDAEASLREANARLPLRQLMGQHGHGPSGGGNWKSFKCPFCPPEKDASAGLFDGEKGEELFKCHRDTCPAGAKALDTVGYLAQTANLSRGEAFQQYLKAAGVWKERARYKPEQGSENEPKPPLKDAKGHENEPKPAENDAKDSESATKPPVSDAKDPENGAAAAADGASDEAESSFETALPAKPSAKPAAPSPEKPKAAAPGEIRAEASEDVMESAALAALQEFYDHLTFSEADERKIWEKRGLITATQIAMGYRSNPRSAQDFLLRMEDRYSIAELTHAGLWVKRGLVRKPDSQFYGYGRASKKLKAERRDAEDKWVYGWTHPPFIPYLNEQGELVALRPHKGGGRAGTVAGTPRLYVPRRYFAPTGGLVPGRITEQFYNVVVTEGEFKAAALWQEIGGGRTDGRKPWGVAALPGITMARNVDLRWELDRWLRGVGARNVVVAYDSEEKGDPALESYQEDVVRRHDVVVWARYLAQDLARKLNVRGGLCLLPAAWRDAKGKADWDGALAAMLAGRLSPELKAAEEEELKAA